MNFSQQVKKIKEEKNITNEQLSERSGIAFSTLNKILSNDDANPKLGTSIAIARALECPLAYLIDGDGASVCETLTDDERELVKSYRTLDAHGRELVDVIIEKELARIGDASSEQRSATVLKLSPTERYRSISLYDLPVSAGLGSFLDSDATEELRIKVTRTSAAADYALRISGNSMEPEFCDGDILLVREQSELDVGELGIFIGDGEGYFKRFMGQTLRSLNPAYKDIPISSFGEFRCCGKVIGRTKA